MKFFLVLIFICFSKNLTKGQNPVEKTIFCNEKFKDTHRNYTGYQGCLIEKGWPPAMSK